jgi:hypothetical protein
MIRKSIPKIKSSIINNIKNSKAISSSGLKKVTITNANIKSVKRTSEVAASGLTQVVDTQITKEAANLGVMSTAGKRADTGGYIVRAVTDSVEKKNMVLQALDDYKVNTINSSASHWTQIHSDKFVSDRIKR